MRGTGGSRHSDRTGAPFMIEAGTGLSAALIDAPAYAAGAVASSSMLSGGGYAQQCVALKVVAATDTITVATQAVSNVVYLAPSNAAPAGNDSNAGTQAAPFLSFAKMEAYAVANCPGASGCTFFLENGTYQPATGTGLLSLNCATGGNFPNGTSSAPITIVASNERQAWIKGEARRPRLHHQLQPMSPSKERGIRKSTRLASRNTARSPVSTAPM